MDAPEQKKYKPVVLVVLDGFGVNIDAPESTWRFAQMPTLRSLEQHFPFVTLQASGIAVGLPWGQEGNSEVGHLTLGAGRALYHHLPRIISSIDDKSFFQNPAFVDAAAHAIKNNGAFHIMGLFSSGSVHAYADHLYALLDFTQTAKLQHVYLHLFSDGKDSPPKEAGLFFQHLEDRLAEKYPFVQIASIMGRFFSLDRDENWDRVEHAYRCMTEGKGETFEKASTYINASYEKNVVDGAIEPAAISGAQSRIKSGDAVVFFNYREDSERELAASFVADNFKGFSRTKIENLFFVTMTEYEKNLPVHTAFPPLDIEWPLARTISGAGLKQLHIAETEKYAHVTYFFNGGKETAFPGEDRALVPSPHVAHFDDVPEMSASKITDAVLENISKYDFILVNFANGDMVGHTGNFPATVKAMEVLDFSLGRIIPKILELGGAMIITSDHGNAEEKVYATSGEKRTKHTSNPVPCFIIANEYRRKAPRPPQEIIDQYNTTEGVISDIAPTILALMGVRQSAEMTGINLLKKMK